MRNHIEQRSEAILAIRHDQLEGFHFSSPQEAAEQAVEVLKRARGTVVYFDIDDTSLIAEPQLRRALNRFFKAHDASFIPVGYPEVTRAGGRYFQVPRYQQMAEQIGVPFSTIFMEVALNEKIHAQMYPHKGARELQLALRKRGHTIGGYPTARPHEISRVTAASLKHHGFFPAPVIDVAAENGNLAEAKVAFFKKVIVPNIPEGVEVYLIDDHVATAESIAENCQGKVTPLVPILSRNRHEIPRLQQHGITYGSLFDLAAYFQEK